MGKFLFKHKAEQEPAVTETDIVVADAHSFATQLQAGRSAIENQILKLQSIIRRVSDVHGT